FYTVKSGYNLICMERSNASGTLVICSLDLSQFYSKMWSTNMPAKVKITMWRIVNNYMQTFANLQILHAHGCIVLSLLMILVGRNVWYARNKVVHEGIAPSVNNTISFVVAFLRENDLLSPQDCLRLSRSRDKWQALIVDVVKLNFDVAYDSHSTKSISGVICRDNEGFILAASSTPHWYVAGPFQDEALACLATVNVARDLGFTRVIVEGDSLTVIKKCLSEAIDVSLISLMIADIKHVSKGFVNINFNFVCREANDAAHILAQEGKAYSNPMYWIEEVPPKMMLAATKDCEVTVSD
ncbi:hypothetical protein V6N11_051642, partial [Hibiscus sabdariffa]